MIPLPNSSVSYSNAHRIERTQETYTRAWICCPGHYFNVIYKFRLRRTGNISHPFEKGQRSDFSRRPPHNGPISLFNCVWYVLNFIRYVSNDQCFIVVAESSQFFFLFLVRCRLQNKNVSTVIKSRVKSVWWETIGIH